MTTAVTLSAGTKVFWSLSRGASWYRGSVMFDDGSDVHVRDIEAVQVDIRKASKEQLESPDFFPWKSADLVDPCFDTACDIGRHQALTAEEVAGA